jgi:tRNA(Ile)-lysidine synthetase-like protein
MIEEVLKFWYSNGNSTFRPEWFKNELDEPIKKRFGELFTRVEDGMCEDWKGSKYGKLAYIIVLDQFTRNLNRDRDFRRNDRKVLELVEDMLKAREDLQYSTMCERMFILLPLRHSKSSSNIRKVLTILEEYKTNIDNLEVLEKFKSATIRDLTMLNTEYIYSKPTLSSITKDYSDVLDLDYGDREKLNDKIDLEAIVSKFINKYNINRVGLSLSGGIDSMVLLEILSKLLGKENVIAVYVSHNNRDIAKRELQFLVEWCSYKGILFVYRKVDYMNRESVEREFYEEETKNLRFGLYRHVINEFSLDGMCLGHHRDDIGENVMMNILQNRDVIELKGMTDRKHMKGVNICRPMLEIKKDVVWAYGKTHNISCFLDSTPDWSWRGVLRNQIYPILDTRVDSIHTILAGLGDRSEEWNIILERMVFEPIFKNIKYLKYGFILKLDKTALEMPSSFYTKILLHTFHTINVRMISVKNLTHFLEWMRDTTKDTYCSLSNGYTVVKADGDFYFVKDTVLVKDNWKYEVIRIDIEDTKDKKVPCSWLDILNGYYEFTCVGQVEIVKIFVKSDNNRRLYKGFSFLPKFSSRTHGKEKSLIKIMM